MLRKGIDGLADDEVIQYANVNQGQGLFEFYCNYAVRLTGVTNAGRVIMGVMCPVYLCVR
jgi:hypothetical protein